MAQDPTDPGSVFAELGRIKLSDTDLDGVLDRVAGLAKAKLPGAAEVSITLVPRTGPHTAAFTGDTALQLDEVQYRKGTGPCLDAAAGQATVSVPDTTDDDRWDGWAAHASAAGIGSSLSVGLPILDTIDGAVNIYGRRRHAFDDATIRLARTFAGYAGTALANAHLYDSTASLAQHMQAAMENRAVIEQAKGIIMGERRCTADEAFAILTRASQDSNRKVREVAAALVAATQSPNYQPPGGASR
ncbi:GAF and ANTAR domain-containing protein [Actinoplanes friuliensis]|uniref:ANTAR domain-containing protein n=1 Tax=Actinoplanes friuliensis DSM 7358 TaxID=1246995 RepID=U5VXC0_9ACTN|nr:GAF and ANTAR domain-containing protein [Actinoplanes friuliensis]AGZ41603.1 ANTAR domain-containing protein [Actinoplanes friuliensis DSM 7358]